MSPHETQNSQLTHHQHAKITSAHTLGNPVSSSQILEKNLDILGTLDKNLQGLAKIRIVPKPRKLFTF